MTPQETLVITRYIKASCPQQAIDEYTPEAWHDQFRDLSMEDCRAATAAVIGRQPFVSPSEIRAEVRRIREQRIARSVIEAPPPELADDPRAYCRELAKNVKRAADGLAPPAEAPALPAGTQGQRHDGRPASLREAIAGLRASLGPARNRDFRSPQQVALDQVAESRAKRPADDERPQEDP